MAMSKGVSHKQEFFESQIFSCQNWPKREIYAKGQKCACPHLPPKNWHFPEEFGCKSFWRANKKMIVFVYFVRILILRFFYYENPTHVNKHELTQLFCSSVAV